MYIHIICRPFHLGFLDLFFFIFSSCSIKALLRPRGLDFPWIWRIYGVHMTRYGHFFSQ